MATASAFVPEVPPSLSPAVRCLGSSAGSSPRSDLRSCFGSGRPGQLLSRCNSPR